MSLTASPPPFPALPTLEEALKGTIPWGDLNTALKRHTEDLWRVHFHGGLVRLLDDIPELVGFDLFLPNGTLSLKCYATPVVSPEAPAALKRCEAALVRLRSGMPRDNNDLSTLLGDVHWAMQGRRPYDPLRQIFRLDRGNADLYLTHMCKEVGPWAAATRAKERLARAVAPAEAERPSRPRL